MSQSEFRVVQPGRSRFFGVMGLLALAVAVIGFSKTFLAPLATGTFRAPPIVYVHAASTFSWIMIFAIQPLLIRARKFHAHKSIGVLAVIAAAGFASTTVPVGAVAAARDYANGGGEAAISGIVGTFTATLIFVALVFAGVLTRKNAETHKRFMLLATIAVLWPAWFRFRHYFPNVPRPDIFFAVVLADSLVAVAAFRDWFVLGRIHPVWLFCGSALIVEHSAEVILFDSPPWRALAHALYGLFSP